MNDLAEYLKRYQSWRRGEDDCTMEEADIKPKELGEKIDEAIKWLELMSKHSDLAALKNLAARQVAYEDASDITDAIHEIAALRCYRENHMEVMELVQANQKALIEAQAEIERLKGIKPELPPYPPLGEGLPRYGIRWNGSTEPITALMDDGYWTPWHLADAFRRDRDELNAQAETWKSEYINELRSHIRFSNRFYAGELEDAKEGSILNTDAVINDSVEEIESKLRQKAQEDL
jgi:hypothetical protein